MANIKSKLTLAHVPVFCPECDRACLLSAASKGRFIVRHDDQRLVPCKNDGKAWTLPQKSIEAVEV